MRALVVAIAVLLFTGCNRTKSAPIEGRPIVLRDPQGHATLTVLRTASGARWMTAVDGKDGVVEPFEGGLRARDARGLAATLKTRPGGHELRDDRRVVVRLDEIDGGLRLGDGRGIPLGRVRIATDEATAYDAGGVLIAQARVAGGRIVISDREGATLGFATGPTTPARVVLAQLPELSALQRVLLFASQ